jgi:hypothetical protein
MAKTTYSTLVILPGNSPKNKEWAISARGAFMSLFKSVIINEYDHWNNNKESIDLNLEANKLAGIIRSADQPIEIFAKSAGIILVLYAVHNKIISASKIHKCIFECKFIIRNAYRSYLSGGDFCNRIRYN